MTTKQRAHFFGTLWPRACERMGWDPADRELRLKFFKVELGTPKSFADFSQEDYDKVKATCLAIASPEDLHAQLRLLSQPRERRLFKLRELRACLALYLKNPAAYEQAILERRFNGQRPDDMPDRDLDQYLQTLNARLNGAHGLRARALQSVHDMRLAAGLRCDCRKCHE